MPKYESNLDVIREIRKRAVETGIRKNGRKKQLRRDDYIPIIIISCRNCTTITAVCYTNLVCGAVSNSCIYRKKNNCRGVRRARLD
jgi:hypothetical protein